MPFPVTPSNTPSVTPTKSVTPSLTPTETPTGTVCPISPSVTPTFTPTPSITQTITPTVSLGACRSYTASKISTFLSVSDINWTDCYGVPQSQTLENPPVTYPESITFCALAGSLVYLNTEISVVDNGPCVPVTQTITPTITSTPSNTPTLTPTNTITPTITSTPSNTPTLTPTNTPSPSSTGFTPEYQAVLTRGTALGYTLPPYSEQVRQNQLVSDLLSNGIWSKLGFFYLFAQNMSGATGDFTLINWITPANTPLSLRRATTGDTFSTFTDFSGWTFNRNNWIQFVSPANPSTATVNPITIASGGTEGIWATQFLSGSSSGTNTYFSTDNNGWNRLLANNSTGHWAFRGIGLTANADMTGTGFRSMTLSGAVSAVTAVDFYSGTTKLARTKTATDTLIAGGNMLINGTGTNRFGWTCGAFFSGIALTDTETTTLSTLLDNFI